MYSLIITANVKGVTSRPSIASPTSSAKTKTGYGMLPTIWKSRMASAGSMASEDGVLSFTDFGIETLIELIKMYKYKLPLMASASSVAE
jgi:hypothetical protein